MQSPTSGTNVTTKVHVLESDGVCRYMFTYLLKMQKQLRAVRETRESLGLPPLELGRLGPPPQPGDDDDSNGLCFFPAIPETVVYEHDFPQAWYTYDTKTKELNKQCGKYLDVMEIFKGFSVVHDGCGDICAQFVGIQRGGGGSKGKHTAGGSSTAASSDGSFRASPQDAGRDSTEVLYFTPETLLAWLRETSTQRPKEGLLQAFVPPRGARNDCLQVLWSPNASHLLRRANKHPLHSMRLDGRTRCATFDAAPHLVEETTGNVLVLRQIEASLNQVSQYLLKAEHKVVSRMVLHLKYDRDGLLWMLYATSLRVENSEVIGTCVVRDPADLESFYQQPTSTCSNDAIDTALRLQTTMTPLTERWKHFNTVHHVEGNGNRFSMRGLQRRDTKLLLSTASQWTARSAPGAAPAEIKQLGCFIEDTLYTLYAARMTTHRSSAQAFDVLVQLPQRLHDFLDVHGTDQLMVSILGMEAAEAAQTTEAPAESSGEDGQHRLLSMGAVDVLPRGLLYRLLAKGAATQRPLSIVRSECEAFLAQIKAMYAAT